GRSGLLAFVGIHDQADPETALPAPAITHQVEVARLEDAQAQSRSGQEHGRQRKQGQRFVLHRRQPKPAASSVCAADQASARAARNRRGALSNPPFDMNTTWSPASARLLSTSTSASTSGTAMPSPRNAPTTAPASHAS